MSARHRSSERVVPHGGAVFFVLVVALLGYAALATVLIVKTLDGPRDLPVSGKEVVHEDR